jgi:microcystin-dependent protein
MAQIDTTNLDAGTDKIKLARPALKSIADWINGLMGYAGGTTPSAPEKAAIQSALGITQGMPSGTVFYSASNTAPTGSLKANGAAVSRSTYADLFSALVTSAGFTSKTFTVTIAAPAVFTMTAHGFTGGERIRLSTTGALPTGLNTTTDYYVIYVSANTFQVTSTLFGTAITTSGTQSGTHTYIQSLWGLGDGTTTFNLPDLRGEFIRGWADGRAVDTGRSMGSAQADDLKAHTHTYTAAFSATVNVPIGSPNASNVGFSPNTATGSTGGTETRPRNIALLACIKF